MTEQFDIYERLYRAVYPPEIMPMFWKENGEISSAVFKDTILRIWAKFRLCAKIRALILTGAKARLHKV